MTSVFLRITRISITNIFATGISTIISMTNIAIAKMSIMGIATTGISAGLSHKNIACNNDSSVSSHTNNDIA